MTLLKSKLKTVASNCSSRLKAHRKLARDVPQLEGQGVIDWAIVGNIDRRRGWIGAYFTPSQTIWSRIGDLDRFRIVGSAGLIYLGDAVAIDTHFGGLVQELVTNLRTGIANCRQATDLLKRKFIDSTLDREEICVDFLHRTPLQLDA